MNNLIIPAILEKDLINIKEKLYTAEEETSLIHLDIEDGSFTENSTFCDIKAIEAIETSAELQLHLMVQRPQDFIPETNSIIKNIILHVESDYTNRELLQELTDKEFELGLALNPETDIYEIEPFLDFLSCVQFMTVNPGFQNSPYVPEVLKKIKEFREYYPHLQIQVDGGMSPETIKQAQESGADLFVVGHYLFESEDEFSERLQALQELTYES